MDSSSTSKTRLPVLALAALGVVYGDIGTSPLYTMKEVFAVGHHPVPLTHDNVFGILSLIVWALIMVVSVKYLVFIMRANNRGEGGIMALLALASRNVAGNARKQHAILLTGILGACMFYADGMITPAISVLSAVEGLEVATPALKPVVIPVTLVVLFLLFWAQSKGTALVGAFFGPVMLLWFSTLAILGIVNILHEPLVLQALNPVYGFYFFTANPWLAFVALGAVVLAVTGTEALYADMGHFGHKPISVAWFGLVLPALILNYFGQGALILHDAETVRNPFYLMAPEWMLYPLVALATMAAIIASQAVISGAFSVSRQALQLGFLPRMQVQHTSEREEGQIYMPRVNWGLMVGVMALVIGFESSGNLAAAYGIAVTGDMVITTLLAGVVFHVVWGWSWLRTGLLVALFLVVDLAFFGANVLKIPDGGWFPLLIGIVIFTLMTTWKTGRNLLLKRLRSEAMELEPFIEA
ncbi:MAG TPA: KUP/HAK/KT family potassium transporter, partial [Methylophilaceae bacterium]|nr:KUP/HAK/KT family potassium transporter [Methylophilaceae bacterium]